MSSTQGQEQQSPPDGHTARTDAGAVPPRHGESAMPEQQQTEGQAPHYMTMQQGQMGQPAQQGQMPQYMYAQQPPQEHTQGQMPQAQMPHQAQMPPQMQQMPQGQIPQYMYAQPGQMPQQGQLQQGQLPQGQYMAPQGYYVQQPNAQGMPPQPPLPPEGTPAPEAGAEAPRCACNTFFNALSKIAPLALLIILCGMAWPMFFQPTTGTYCPAEIKPLSAFIHSIAQNSWLAPAALDNGAFTSAQWPVFSWFIGLFAFIPQVVEQGLLLPLATFTATFLAVLGVWALGLSARFGGRTAFAGALILLCAPIFAPLPHFVGPAALAAALMLFALAFFCRGWQRPTAWLSLPLAFVLTALAGLCGGLLHFAVPLLASFCFIIWRGNPRRAQRADALFGFVLMLAIVGGWLGALMIGNGHDAYINELLGKLWLFSWPLPWTSALPIIVGLVGLLPWVLLIFGASWLRILARSVKTLGASRRENGSAFIWLALVFAACLALVAPAMHPAAIAIACLTATLLGKAFLNLSGAGNRFFFLLAALLTLAVGLILLGATFPEGQQLLFAQIPFLASIPGLGAKLASLSALRIVAATLIAAGLLAFFFVKANRMAGGLVYAALVVIILCQPCRLMLVPEIAAMPDTPLVNYADVEKQVMAALSAKTQTVTLTPAPDAQPAVPTAPETAAQPGAIPAPEPIFPVIPAEPKDPDAQPAPGAQTPSAPAEAPEASVPGETASDVGGAIVPQDTATPQPGEAAPEAAKPDATAPEAAAAPEEIPAEGAAKDVPAAPEVVEEVIIMEEAPEAPKPAQ